MIKELEMNPSTVILLVVVVILFALALRVAVSTWSGKRDCHGRRGTRAKRISVADEDSSRYPYVETIRVRGMTCDRCRENVEGALNECGDVRVAVDLGSGTATIRSKEPGRTEEFRVAIERAGYAVEAS